MANQRDILAHAIVEVFGSSEQQDNSVTEFILLGLTSLLAEEIHDALLLHDTQKALKNKIKNNRQKKKINKLYIQRIIWERTS